MGDSRAHVALLVDFVNLVQQLHPEGGNGVDPAAQASGREIAQALVRYAAGLGRVAVARAYADWTREPDLSRELGGTRLSPVLVPATDDGEDRSHIRLAVDAMESLYNGDEPDAFVLVTSDPSLLPLVQALRADGSEVVLVSVAAARERELVSEADQFVSFEEILAGRIGEPVAVRPGREREAGGRAAGGRGRGKPREERTGYYAGRPLLTEAEFGDYDWAGFVSLIDELEQRLPFVGVRYLVNKVLGPHNCGIEDPRIKRDLINEAVDEGLIEMYTVGNVHERTDPVTACRLDRDNEIVREILAESAAADDEGFDDELEDLDDGPLASDEYSHVGAARP